MRMARLALATSLVATLVLCGRVWAQGQALPPVKVNLPPPPNFDAATAPVQYPSGEMSVFGVRKERAKYLDKDVRVKGYLLEVYECPEDIRACNEAADAKAKKNRKKVKPGAPPVPPPPSECRPCDQPHFFLSDTPQAKKERALLVSDYPVKDWKTKKPKPLEVKAGEQYVVTGTFAINSPTGFAASNGLVVHKKLEDATGKTIAAGSAQVPPEATMIQLPGQPPQPLAPPKK